MFRAAFMKIYEIDSVIIDVMFKARRSDGLSLLVEAKGMKLDNFDGSIWVARPVALLGNRWKEFGMGPFKVNPLENISPESSPKLSNFFVNNGSMESLNTDLALCHICERTIPALLFENHNMICTNVHRAEMELIVIQESLYNIRSQLLKQDGFLRDELQMELLETENDPEILKDQKLYIDCLNRLSLLSHSMLDKLGLIMNLSEKETNAAKHRIQMGELEPIESLVSWDMPQHIAFFPSSDLELRTEGMQMVKNQLAAIGNNLWTIACAFRSSLPGLKLKLEFLRDSTHFFHLAVLQEENVKFEIGLKAGRASY